MQKIVWQEDGDIKTALGRLDKIEGEFVYFHGERGPLILHSRCVLAVK